MLSRFYLCFCTTGLGRRQACVTSSTTTTSFTSWYSTSPLASGPHFVAHSRKGDPIAGTDPVSKLNWRQQQWIRRASQDKIRTRSGPGSPRGEPAWGGGSDRPNTQVLLKTF